MDPPCSFMDGGGSRVAIVVGSGSGFASTGAGSGILVGSDTLTGSGAFVAGVVSSSTSFMPSPSYKLSIETFGGSPSLPANHSSLVTAGFKPTVGGYTSSWKVSDRRGTM